MISEKQRIILLLRVKREKIHRAIKTPRVSTESDQNHSSRKERKKKNLWASTTVVFGAEVCIIASEDKEEVDLLRPFAASSRPLDSREG